MISECWSETFDVVGRLSWIRVQIATGTNHLVCGHMGINVVVSDNRAFKSPFVPQHFVSNS